MNAPVKTLATLIVALLSACSTAPVQQPNAAAPKAAPESEKPLPPPENPAENINTAVDPPLTNLKNGKTLNLVRIMDGGICINELQGASGSFLVYADPRDIERIKHEKSKEIFKDFEQKIQKMSSEILEQSIDRTNLAPDPFSLGEDANHEKLTSELMQNFGKAAQKPLQAFARETTLTIDILPFPPSLTFYQKGCDLSQFEQ